MSLLEQNYPPILDGIFNVESETFGYLPNPGGGGTSEYGLDDPKFGKYQNVFNQKNEYISLYYDFVYSSKKISPKSYGVWRKKLNKNLEFIGWECLYTNIPYEKDVFILDPTKVIDNHVIEYTVYLLNVGINTNVRSNQTSFICKLTGKKI